MPGLRAHGPAQSLAVGIIPWLHMPANLPPLTYLTVDSMSEWVGRSQVAPYVERLAARGVEVRLHSFEKVPPDPAVQRRLNDAGVSWRPHRFGPAGAAGGITRVLHGAAVVAGARLVHARSDLAAASCLVARPRAWVWDVRGLWREQRTALGLITPGSPQARALSSVEAAAARSSTAIVTLSAAAIEILGERHGGAVVAKTRVVTTCADLDRFQASPLPASPPVRFLLAGTLNRLYDVPAMLHLIERMRRRVSARLTVLTTDAGGWASSLQAVGAHVGQAAPEEMPGVMSDHHVGLSVLRLDAGPSNRAAMPTKLGEFLACGRPVVVNAGLGDMDDLLTRYRCGAVVTHTSDSALDRVVDDVGDLLADPETPARCRALAEEHFNLDRAVDHLLEAYRVASAAPRP